MHFIGEFCLQLSIQPNSSKLLSEWKRKAPQSHWIFIRIRSETKKNEDYKSIRLVVYFIWIRIRFTTRAAKERERKNSEAETKCLAQQFERLARVSSGAAKKPMKRYSKSVWCIEKRNVCFSSAQCNTGRKLIQWNGSESHTPERTEILKKFKRNGRKHFSISAKCEIKMRFPSSSASWSKCGRGSNLDTKTKSTCRQLSESNTHHDQHTFRRM